jgi:putative Mn2+ efflux pump MntP
MDWLSLIALAVALAMDAFAVALAAGSILRPLTFRPCFRLAFHFGLFQGLMPVIGWLAGLTIQGFVSRWSHWIALLLLTGVGGRMIYEALRGEEEERRSSDPSKGLTMVALSVATSIDALAVGITLAMIDVVVWVPALVIGVIACVFTVIGLLLGARIGGVWGTRVEVIGGVVLVFIGCKIAVSSL